MAGPTDLDLAFYGGAVIWAYAPRLARRAVLRYPGDCTADLLGRRTYAGREVVSAIYDPVSNMTEVVMLPGLGWKEG